MADVVHRIGVPFGCLVEPGDHASYSDERRFDPSGKSGNDVSGCSSSLDVSAKKRKRVKVFCRAAVLFCMNDNLFVVKKA